MGEVTIALEMWKVLAGIVSRTSDMGNLRIDVVAVLINILTRVNVVGVLLHVHAVATLWKRGLRGYRARRVATSKGWWQWWRWGILPVVLIWSPEERIWRIA